MRQRLRQRQAVAARRPARIVFPAGLQQHQLHAGRDADDPGAVVGHGGDRAGDRGAVAVAAEARAVAVHEVDRLRDAPLEVRMAGVGAGVDDRDAHVTTRRECLGLRHAHPFERSLQREVRIVPRGRVRAGRETLHRLGALDAGVGTQSFEQVVAPLGGGDAEHDTVYAEYVDAPGGDPFQPVVAGQVACDVLCPCGTPIGRGAAERARRRARGGDEPRRARIVDRDDDLAFRIGARGHGQAREEVVRHRLAGTAGEQACRGDAGRDAVAARGAHCRLAAGRSRSAVGAVPTRSTSRTPGSLRSPSMRGFVPGAAPTV